MNVLFSMFLLNPTTPNKSPCILRHRNYNFLTCLLYWLGKRQNRKNMPLKLLFSHCLNIRNSFPQTPSCVGAFTLGTLFSQGPMIVETIWSHGQTVAMAMYEADLILDKMPHGILNNQEIVCASEKKTRPIRGKAAPRH